MQLSAAGGAPAPLPGTKPGDSEATWSADGTYIAYRSDSDILWVVPGQPAKVLAHREGQKPRDPTFAPAGRVLAFVSCGNSVSDGDLCLLDAGDIDAKQACINDPNTDLGRSVSWSPDGRQIVETGHAVIDARTLQPRSPCPHGTGCERRAVSDADRVTLPLLVGLV